MNHVAPSPVVKPTLQTTAAMDYTPIKDGQTPGKGQQSAQLYYFGQNRTPLNRIQQLSGHCGDSQPMQGCHLKTPNSGCSGGRGKLHAFHNSRTPSSTKPGKHSNSCYNPFEAGLVDVLHGPLFSPNVFKTSTPGSGARTRFQWSIDDIAVLKPVDIEEPSPHDGGVNLEIEERAQKAIDTYFSSQIIVPSPWTDSAKKKPFVLPATPGGSSIMDSPMIFSTKSEAKRASSLSPPKPRPVYRNEPMKQSSKKEVASQTVLTLPMDFDLEAVLKTHYSHHDVEMVAMPSASRQGSCHDEDDGVSQDALSNSSLRRKLFFHGEEGTPISPVRSSRKHSDSEKNLSPDIHSPIKSAQRPLCSSGCDAIESSRIVDLSDIDHFSSSPIKFLHTTPTFRRCSTAPLLMDSPAVSPIRPDGSSSTPIKSKSNTENSQGVAPAVICSSSSEGFHHLQSPELLSSSTSQTHGNFTITPVSSAPGCRRRNLSTIDASFEMKVDDSYLPSMERQVDNVKQVSASRLQPTELFHDSENHDPVNLKAVLLQWHSSYDVACEEMASLSQDPIPSYDSQSAPHAIGTDTGYQSNFLQVTGTTSSSGHGFCLATHQDSVLPSLLAEDMSCDSSFMNTNQVANIATVRDKIRVSSSVDNVIHVPNGRGINDGPIAVSLETLHKNECCLQNMNCDNSASCDMYNRNRSQSQPDIFHLYSEPSA